MKYTYIYYPEYELEHRRLLDNPPHILNIRLLMFLCDHVILPPSHLLSTSTDNILNLINELKEFFDAGKIVTIRYQSGIDGYFESRIEQTPNSFIREAKTIRAETIKDYILSNPTVEHNKTDEDVQIKTFAKKFISLVSEYPIHKKGSAILLNNMDNISNKTGELIHSNQVSEILTNMLYNNDISSFQHAHFLKLMSYAYYSSGTNTMNAIVSYNNYFKKIDLQSILSNPHFQTTNMIVDPHFLQQLFAVMGISMQDICQLSVFDYKEIMSQPCWEKFMTVFDVLYTSTQELELLLKSREKINMEHDRMKKNINWFFDGIILNAISSNINPSINFIINMIISWLRNFNPKFEKRMSAFDNYTREKIIYIINRINDPLYDFSYNLMTYINKLRES